MMNAEEQSIAYQSPRDAVVGDARPNGVEGLLSAVK